MKTKNPNRKGKATEHKIISRLLENDFDVFVPVIDTGIDLIIKDREGRFVEVQVKSRNIKDDNQCFYIKDFKPNHNFFIVCHNIQTDDFFCMPSKKFYQKSDFNEKRGARTITNSTLIKHTWCKNDKGIDLLKKALESEQNRISSYSDN